MEQNRREFIKKALYALFALFGLGFVISALALFFPGRTRAKTLVYFPLLSEEEIPRSGVKRSELNYTIRGAERKMRVFVVSSEKGVHVFSAVCSHLGCLVNYNKEKGEFVCPCHGGRYDLTGRNIAGPPPSPLTALPLKIEKGMVLAGIKV